jgi:hypothetical protein
MSDLGLSAHRRPRRFRALIAYVWLGLLLRRGGQSLTILCPESLSLFHVWTV